MTIQEKKAAYVDVLWFNETTNGKVLENPKFYSGDDPESFFVIIKDFDSFVCPSELKIHRIFKGLTLYGVLTYFEIKLS